MSKLTLFFWHLGRKGIYMGFKKWIAAVAGSGMLGAAAVGGGVIGLVAIGVTGYNILMEPDKLPDEEEEDIAKVHRLGYGECECNCVFIGEAGDTSGGSGNGTGNGTVGGGATSSGSVTFTGTEDKSNFANSAFYFTKIACDELGVPVWIPYAKNSGEDGGSIFNNSVTWNPTTYMGLDANVSTDNIARKSLDKGAAGFFQVEGISVQDEMKFMHENPTKYDSILSKSGLDVSKYPGMQSRLTKEHSIGWTNWYDDCTYYPAALINMLEAFKVRKQISIDKHWLDGYDWFQSATDAEKDLLHTYTALTLWNNGIYAIDEGRNCYNSNPLFAKFLYAFLDITRNRYDEFINTPFPGTYGNSANEGEIKKHTAPARWIIDNSSVLTEEERRAFDAEFKKNGGGDYKNVMLRRFCTYGTVLIYNGMSTLSDQSALNGLAKNGITITGGWSILSEGNTSNLGENNSGGTTSSGGSSGITLDANGISERVENVIYVGDSRFVGMDSYTKKGEDFVVAKVGMGYNWFTSDAMSSIQSIKDANTDVTDWTIVSNLGVNDLHNITNYISKYQEMQNNGDNIVIVSVNPTDKNHNSLNSDIDAFNDKLKGSGLTYIDTNSVLKSDGFETSDGLHYKKDTYIKIWNEINKGLVSNSGGSGGLSSSTRTQGKKINTASNNSERNSGGTGNLGSSGGSNELGKYVDDASLNPQGMPLYDNYTFDPNKYTYRDRNYEQFWDGSTPESDILYGLGDFTNEGAKNRITYESGPSRENGTTMNYSPAFERKNSYALVDGRIVFAIAPAIGANDADLALLQSLVTDASNYSEPSWDDPDVLNGNGNVGGYSGDTSWGLYFDIVLDNGTVVPCVVGDTKAMHHGEWDGQWHDDRLSKGYCQLKYNLDRRTLGYKSIIETCYGNNNDVFTTTLFNGRKICSIRTYEIFHNSKTGWNKYWTEGGSDSSFGLTGGSSTGGAKPGGTGNAALGGTGGGTTTTNNGLNPNDPNWKCDCDIPCEKCMCHDNGVGGPPVGSDGDTVGGGGPIGGNLQETVGTLQGLYCDLSGKQLTPEEVWAMVEAKAPNIAAEYKPHIGVAPVAKITTRDKWRDMFGDMEGAMNYLQHQQPFNLLRHTMNRSKTDLVTLSTSTDYPYACFGSSSCGFCSLSIIASTMLHRYISPPEIIIASCISEQVNPEPTAGLWIYSDNMLSSPNAKGALDSFRYKGQRLFNVDSEPNSGTSLNKAKVDATLEANGLVSVSVHGTWTKGGHFIVIREKYIGDDGNEYYLTVDSSHQEFNEGSRTPGGNPEKPHPFQDFLAVTPNQVNYVTPGPGYQDYINDMRNSNSGSNSGTGSTGNLGNGNGESTTTPDGVTITEHMLSNNSRYLDDIWRDSNGNIPTDAKVFVFKPQNPNGHSVTIDAGHGNNSHPSTSLPTESVFPGLTEDQIKSMGSSATGKAKGVEIRDSKNVFNNSEIEPECTLAVAIKVRDKLLDKGYTVTMTRNLGTQNLSNGTRAVLGCETSEIYVAIHTNASEGRGARGVISFYPGDGNNDPNDPRPGYTRLLGLDANKAESKRLAQELSYGVHNATPGLPLNGSGVSEHVLRIFSYSNKPIALIELAFSDDRADAQILIEKKEEMAQGIVNGIDKYFGY